MALTYSNYKLGKIAFDAFTERNVRIQIQQAFIGLSIAAVAILNVEQLNELSYPLLAVYPLAGLLVARSNLPELKWIPVISLFPDVLELFSADISITDWWLVIEPLSQELWQPYITMLIVIVAAVVVTGSIEIMAARQAVYWSLFVLYVPLVAIVLAYLRLSGAENALDWGAATVIIGLLYTFLLDRWRRRKGEIAVEAVLATAVQSAFAVASFFAFSDVTLTLVLAVQLVGLAWLDTRYRIARFPLILKIMLMLVIARLTLNPWILLYDVNHVTILLTYIGCLFATLLAARELRHRPELKVWIYSASAHLLVLSIVVSTRFLIYGGDIFARHFTLTESSIYINSLAALGLVYDWRARQLEQRRWWYQLSALLHTAVAGLLYVIYNILLHNPLWSVESIGSTPVFNLLLAGYGLPVLMMALTAIRMQLVRRPASLVMLTGFYLFITLETRHLWNAGMMYGRPVGEGELYTYSLVWLLTSVAVMLFGAYRNNAAARHAGIVGLLVVITKVFLWDMSDLAGLWRVVSFLGLGISLLGVAYLFNKLKTIDKH